LVEGQGPDDIAQGWRTSFKKASIDSASAMTPLGGYLMTNKVFGPDEEPNTDMNQLRNAKSSIEEEPSSPPPTPTFRYEDGSGKQVLLSELEVINALENKGRLFHY